MAAIRKGGKPWRKFCTCRKNMHATCKIPETNSKLKMGKRNKKRDGWRPFCFLLQERRSHTAQSFETEFSKDISSLARPQKELPMLTCCKNEATFPRPSEERSCRIDEKAGSGRRRAPSVHALRSWPLDFGPCLEVAIRSAQGHKPWLFP